MLRSEDATALGVCIQVPRYAPPSTRDEPFFTSEFVPFDLERLSSASGFAEIERPEHFVRPFEVYFEVFHMTTSFSRRDLLCFSHLRWNFVTQRPQHLLTRAARERRVFFFEEPLFDCASLDAQQPHLEAVVGGQGVTVVRPHLLEGSDVDATQARLLADFLAVNAIAEYDAWFYTPMARAFTQALRPHVLVYDCMDELKNFLHAPPQMAALEQDLLRHADVVFTGGSSLYESKRASHPSVFAFPSSIEAEHFAKALSAEITEPADQVGLPHPRAGFYGVVDERFDIPLLRDVAALRPEVQFIILGPVVKIDPAALPQAANIHYLGSKTYQDLPAYLSGWDAALLPFAINEATRFISPTKTPEYLAAGRRVVSTPIRDVVTDYGDEGLVEIAGTAPDFAVALDRALEVPGEHWLRAVTEKLSSMSWDNTWQGMQAEMDAAERRRSAAVRTVARVSPLHLKPNTSRSVPLAPASVSGRSGSKFLHSAKSTRHSPFDTVVVGAGFAGSVLAERLASQLGKRVLIIDKREHIAGNAYDHLNEDRILVHRYGPHIFHTNADNVVHYLSQFTKWYPYEHRVLANVHGKLVSVPINLRTVNELYDLSLDAAGMRQFLAQRAVPCANIRTSEDIVLSRVGRELYETFFRNYTRKQWGLDPSELDASVAGRIPVRFDNDDRYFTDTFQAMPLHGYTRMFERMLDHSRITVQLGVSFEEVRKEHPGAHIVFTGPIDEFFGFRFGPLPYRSLEFRHETHDVERFQPVGVVNFPNDHEYTRVTEFKTLTGQKHAKTSIVYEYPRASGDPYYPIPRPENAALYAKYRSLAEDTPNVTFCGRLANYKYFNMDQVVAQALSTFERLAQRESLEATNLQLQSTGKSRSTLPVMALLANEIAQQ